MGEDNYKLFQPTNIIMIRLFVMRLKWTRIMSWQFDVNVPCKGGGMEFNNLCFGRAQDCNTSFQIIFERFQKKVGWNSTILKNQNEWLKYHPSCGIIWLGFVIF